MEQLEKANTDYIPLLTLMGENYTATQQYQKALNIYNRLIPLLEQNPQNKPLIEAYIARSKSSNIKSVRLFCWCKPARAI